MTERDNGKSDRLRSDQHLGLADVRAEPIMTVPQPMASKIAPEGSGTAAEVEIVIDPFGAVTSTESPEASASEVSWAEREGAPKRRRALAATDPRRYQAEMIAGTDGRGPQG